MGGIATSQTTWEIYLLKQTISFPNYSFGIGNGPWDVKRTLQRWVKATPLLEALKFLGCYVTTIAYIFKL